MLYVNEKFRNPDDVIVSGVSNYLICPYIILSILECGWNCYAFEAELLGAAKVGRERY